MRSANSPRSANRWRCCFADGDAWSLDISGSKFDSSTDLERRFDYLFVNDSLDDGINETSMSSGAYVKKILGILYK